MTSFVKQQQAIEKKYRNRGRVICVSCQIVEVPKMDIITGEPELDTNGKPVIILTKHPIQGQMLVNRHGVRGKAAKKAAKKLTHVKNHYRQQRAA